MILVIDEMVIAGKAGFPNLPALTYTASGEERGMIVFKVFGGRGTVGVRGMIVFKVFGGRGTVGVRGMIVLKFFGGRGSVGLRGMIVAGKPGFPNLAALTYVH